MLYRMFVTVILCLDTATVEREDKSQLLTRLISASLTGVSDELNIIVEQGDLVDGVGLSTDLLQAHPTNALETPT